MSKVVNMGVIIRNEQGDTFPVALNPQMVGVIQNLLMQVPVMDSKILDASGKKVASNTSIPIIPREIEFDWEAAYAPMERGAEMELLKKLNERYAAMDEASAIDGNIPQVLESEKEERGAFTDPENPFNLELEATGRANVDVVEGGKTNQELIQDGKYPDPIGKQEGEEIQEVRQDVIVTPPALPLSGEAPQPGQ